MTFLRIIIMRRGGVFGEKVGRKIGARFIPDKADFGRIRNFVIGARNKYEWFLELSQLFVAREKKRREMK